MRNLFVFSLLLFAIASCKDDKTSYEIDDEIIREYLAKTGIDATKHESGLYYIIEKEGVGDAPSYTSNVVVKYYVYYTDSTPAETPPNPNPLEIPLKSCYSGWIYGLPLFNEGGKGKLFLPRHLGKPYGSKVTIFDIELREVFE